MGNGAFAVPALQRIARSEIEVATVVTNMPKRGGRGQDFMEVPVAIQARSLEIPVLQPSDLTDPNFISRLKNIKAAAIVVIAYRIIPDDLFTVTKYGAINLHPSLLPKYRGAAPIQWALINGESRTGITTFVIQKKVDAGKILMQQTVEIEENENFDQLSYRLSRLGADLMIETLKNIQNNNIEPVQQNEVLVTKAPKITADHCRIDWELSATEIFNLIRGLSSLPGAFTYFNGKRLKIFSGLVADQLNIQKSPGEIIVLTKSSLVVQTGKSGFSVKEVQVEGKKRMEIPEFLAGSNINIGDFFR
jgi:methionyl-tRNA formyltransferase